MRIVLPSFRSFRYPLIARNGLPEICTPFLVPRTPSYRSYDHVLIALSESYQYITHKYHSELSMSQKSNIKLFLLVVAFLGVLVSIIPIARAADPLGTI